MRESEKQREIREKERRRKERLIEIDIDRWIDRYRRNGGETER